MIDNYVSIRLLEKKVVDNCDNRSNVDISKPFVVCFFSPTFTSYGIYNNITQVCEYPVKKGINSFSNKYYIAGSDIV